MNYEHGIYDSKEYKSSGFAYKLECTFEYFVTLLVTGVYLSSLLKAVGMPDSMVGIVSSIQQLAFVFQLLSLFLVQKITNTKRVTSIIHSLGRLFFTTLFFIPFMPFVNPEHRQILAVICIILGYFGYYVVTSIIYKWGNSFVHPTKRSTFSASKEMLSLLGGIIFTFIMGQVVDFYAAKGNSDASFIFLGVTVLIATIADFVCLMIMKNEENPHEKIEIEPIGAVMKSLFKNKSYIYLIIFSCICRTSLTLLNSFIYTFQLGELEMSVGLVSIITIVASMARFLASKPLGKFSDRTSYVTGITLGLVIQSFSYILAALSFPGMWTRWLIVGYSVLYNVSMAAISANLYNTVYSYVEKDYFVQGISIMNSIAGIVGFLVSLGAAAIVEAIQTQNATGALTVFGVSVYAQQVIAIISLVIAIIGIVFSQLIMRKQKITIQ